MAVKFKVIQRSQPGVPGGGEKKYYAIPVSSGKLTTSEMISRIEKISTVSGADVHGSIYGAVDVSIVMACWPDEVQSLPFWGLYVSVSVQKVKKRKKM